MARTSTRSRLHVEAMEDRTVPSVTADFNGDGYGDLAIGVPGANDNGLEDVGAVHVVSGTASGLSAENTLVILQGMLTFSSGSGTKNQAEAGDRFGAALAAGDFNGDGYSDLAVGSPGESYDGFALRAGIVHVLFGSETGLATEGVWHIRQSDQLITLGGSLGDHDRLGAALAVGDFNGDGLDDLAVGVPGEDAGGNAQEDHGVVHVVYGAADGFNRSGQTWSQDTPGVPGEAAHPDNFGWSLAAGDFNGDGYDELAVGAPFERVGGVSEAGTVVVLPGSAAGLRGMGSRLWSQDSYGIADTAESGDEYGRALAAGDFNGDGRDDLAVGVPDEGLGARIEAGAVHVIYGSATGLTPVGNQFWHQDSPGVADTIEAGDHFGWSLAAADFDGDGRADLAIGAPDEDLGAGGRLTNSGVVHVLYGAAGRLRATGSQLWVQGNTAGAMLGAGETREANDCFGWALTVGDFDGDGADDLAVAAPFEDLDSFENGVVHALYGVADLGLRTAGRQVWSQEALGIFGDPEDNFGMGLGR